MRDTRTMHALDLRACSAAAPSVLKLS